MQLEGCCCAQRFMPRGPDRAATAASRGPPCTGRHNWHDARAPIPLARLLQAGCTTDSELDPHVRRARHTRRGNTGDAGSKRDDAARRL